MFYSIIQLTNEYKIKNNLVQTKNINVLGNKTKLGLISFLKDRFGSSSRYHGVVCGL